MAPTGRTARLWTWPLLLVVLSFAVRAVFIGALPPAVADPIDLLFFDVLREDLWGWLAYSPRKPPLFALLHVPLLHLFDNGTIVALRLAEWQLAVINSIAIGLLAGAAQRLGASGPVAAIFLLLYSLALLPIETQPTNYDQPLVFCTALVLLAAAAYVHHPRSAVGLGLAGGLLALTSTVAPAVLGAVTVLLALTTHRGMTWPHRAIALTAMLAPAALVTLALSVKNYYAVGTFAAANGAGHAAILNVVEQIHGRTADLRRLAVEAGAPDWYLWCFDRPTQAARSGNDIHPRTQGYCVDDTGSAPGIPVWPVDFAPLAKALDEIRAREILDWVERDRRDAEAGGRHFVPFGFFDSRFFAAYSRWNERIARHVFLAAPGAWMAHVLRKHGDIWLSHGPIYPAIRLRTPYWTLGGDAAPGIAVLERAAKSFARLMRATYRGIPWALGLVLAGFAACALFRRYAGADRASVSAVWPAVATLAAFEAALAGGARTRPDFERTMRAVAERGDLRALRPGPETVAAAIVFSVPVAVMATIFLGYVGTEGDRFFLQTLPYLCLGGSVFVSLLLRPAWLLLPRGAGSGS